MRVLLAISVFAALALASGASSMDNPTLLATVGPGFSIRIGDTAGNRVTSIPPGTYTIKVSDLSPEHNFHLSGTGVDMATQVETTGAATWTVMFQVGTYHYECDAHPTTMKGDLTVSADAPPVSTNPVPTPTPPPAKRPLVLAATVGPASIALKTLSGRQVVRIKAGPVVIGVSDLSARHNFHLVGPGVNRMTTRPGKVKVSWRLTLKRGTYVYRSDAAPLRLRGTFRVV